jgi:ATP-dependent RNA helicase RhlE
MNFEQLKLKDPLLRAIRNEGYQKPTPIQEKAVPAILDGRDLLGCAQTGTGKTAAFALPILQQLLAHRSPNNRRPPIRVLVIAPTRELTTQVNESFAVYGRYTGLRTTAIFGGVSQKPQVRALMRGVDIVVATPGRLLDLMNQGHIHLESLEILVLDEADRMLDMGFLPDVRRIVGKVPKQRQTLMFSATMPDDIRRLADRLLTRPLRVSVAPTATPADGIEQSVYLVDKKDKTSLLVHLLKEREIPRMLVFTRTKYGADKLTRKLNRARIDARAIHGDKSQGQREKTLGEFRRGRLRVLVATDIASRGLDIDDISHIVNYDMPQEAENYVHRIGRTARAGASGKAIAFCDRDECEYLLEIERLIHYRIEEVKDHPYHPRGAASSSAPASSSGNHNGNTPGRLRPPRRRRRSSGNGNGGRSKNAGHGSRSVCGRSGSSRSAPASR